MLGFSDNTISVIVVCWIGGMVLTIPRIRKKTITLHGIWLYLSIVGILTALRTGLFIYLTFVVPNWEHNRFERMLSISLYPEAEIFRFFIMHLMAPPVYPTFWLILISMIFVGSCVWLSPVLVLITKEKEGANLP